MSFRTKIDMSNNRQLNQYIETLTRLSGATQFGVLFNQLPTGPNPSVSGTSSIGTNLISTFSGNSATTIFTWYDARMELGHTRISAITPTNSATTQYTGNVWTGNTSTTIDGNSLFLTYSGVNFDTNVTAMSVLGANSYSGTINSVTVLLLTASTLDFTGRTIWCDVSGFTRTNELIINKTPTIGYTWTCIDAEGRGIWSPLGSGTTNYWSATTGGTLFGIVQNNGGNTASGNLGLASGSGSTASGPISHAEGLFTTSSNLGSHSEGILTISSGGGSHSEGSGTTSNNTATHAEGFNTIASGNSAHSEGRVTIAGGSGSHAQNFAANAFGAASHAGGSGTTASGSSSFIHSVGSTAGGNRSAVLGGQNINGLVDDTVYVPYLNISYSGTPSSSGDTMGNIGALRWDNNYIYLKTLSGWGRTLLSYAF